ncbi:hypothetical protein BsWGS_11560 [Bradybaena similaris]
MAQFCSWALALHVAACLVTITHGTFYPNLISLSDKCQQRYRVWGDVRIRLTANLLLPTNTTCTLKLQPDIDTRLIARFRSYYMSPDYTSEQDRCRYESIQLYDSLGHPQLDGGDGGYCRTEKPTNLIDLGASGQFRYTTSRAKNILAADLEIVVTAVTDKQGENCPSDYFDCHFNNYCVSNAVTCNGFDDCGNNRDETTACPLSPWIILVAVLGGIFVFGCIVVFVICLLKCGVRCQYERV